MRLRLVLVLLVLGGPALAQFAPVDVKRVFSSTKTAAGQPITLPAGEVEVSVLTYDIAPGARLPVHKHPFARYAYVLGGDLTVTDADTGAATTYHAGDVVIEMIDRWHFAENAGTSPVRLLVFDQTPVGQAATVLRAPQ